MTKIEQIQQVLSVDIDNRWGAKSQAALDHAIAESRINPVPVTGKKILGDGTWPWTAWINGEDVIVDSCRMTCFGGSSDPQDSGETASGISTKTNPQLKACSLPMDGRAFPGLSRAEHAALDGSPIPRVPFQTRVRVTAGLLSFEVPVIDLGPAKRTGNALDLTIAAARLINPMASARNFEAKGSYRIVGAAKYVRA